MIRLVDEKNNIWMVFGEYQTAEYFECNLHSPPHWCYYVTDKAGNKYVVKEDINHPVEECNAWQTS